MWIVYQKGEEKILFWKMDREEYLSSQREQ
jgi:hypothetical protein